MPQLNLKKLLFVNTYFQHKFIFLHYQKVSNFVDAKKLVFAILRLGYTSCQPKSAYIITEDTRRRKKAIIFEKM